MSTLSIYDCCPALSMKQRVKNFKRTVFKELPPSFEVVVDLMDFQQTAKKKQALRICNYF